MPVSIKEEEQLSETVKEFPVLYEKATKGYKEKDAGKAATRGVLRNFTKFTGKYLFQSLFFNKVSGLRPATLFKKRLWHRCFPVNFVKFLRTPIFT